MTTVLDRPTDSTPAETIQLILDLTPAMKAVLDELAAREGITHEELLRRAVALLKTVKDAQQEGLSPALIDAEGAVNARLVGV